MTSGSSSSSSTRTLRAPLPTRSTRTRRTKRSSCIVSSSPSSSPTTASVRSHRALLVAAAAATALACLTSSSTSSTATFAGMPYHVTAFSGSSSSTFGHNYHCHPLRQRQYQQQHHQQRTFNFIDASSQRTKSTLLLHMNNKGSNGDDDDSTFFMHIENNHENGDDDNNNNTFWWNDDEDDDIEDTDNKKQSSTSASSSTTTTTTTTFQLVHPPYTTMERERRLIELELLLQLQKVPDDHDSNIIPKLKQLWFSERSIEIQTTLTNTDLMISSNNNPKQWKIAEELLVQLLQNDPTYWEPAVQLSKLFCLQGRYDESEELCLQLISFKPWHFVVLETLVTISMKRHDFQKAQFWSSRRLPSSQSSITRRQNWIERAIYDCHILFNQMESNHIINVVGPKDTNNFKKSSSSRNRNTYESSSSSSITTTTTSVNGWDDDIINDAWQ